MQVLVVTAKIETTFVRHFIYCLFSILCNVILSKHFFHSSGQDADANATAGPDTSDPSGPNRCRREGCRQQRVRLHPERLPRGGRDVAVQKCRKVALHSHARISGSFRTAGVPQTDSVTQIHGQTHRIPGRVFYLSSFCFLFCL